jgi:hypothetical protein
MRTIESIRQSLSRFGYTHVRKDQHTLEEAQKLAEESGGRIEATTSFHYTLVPAVSPAVSGTDWEELRRQQFEKRQKLAANRKKKEQNT